MDSGSGDSGADAGGGDNDGDSGAGSEGGVANGGDIDGQGSAHTDDEGIPVGVIAAIVAVVVCILLVLVFIMRTRSQNQAKGLFAEPKSRTSSVEGRTPGHKWDVDRRQQLGSVANPTYGGPELPGETPVYKGHAGGPAEDPAPVQFAKPVYQIPMENAASAAMYASGAGDGDDEDGDTNDAYIQVGAMGNGSPVAAPVVNDAPMYRVLDTGRIYGGSVTTPGAHMYDQRNPVPSGSVGPAATAYNVLAGATTMGRETTTTNVYDQRVSDELEVPATPKPYSALPAANLRDQSATVTYDQRVPVEAGLPAALAASYNMLRPQLRAALAPAGGQRYASLNRESGTTALVDAGPAPDAQVGSSTAA